MGKIEKDILTGVKTDDSEEDEVLEEGLRVTLTQKEKKEKKKREYVMTPARKEAFERMKAGRAKKNEMLKEKKEMDKQILENAYNEEQPSKVKKQTKNRRRKNVIVLEDESSSSDEENRIVIRRKTKKKKKKPVITNTPESSETETEDEVTQIVEPPRLRRL